MMEPSSRAPSPQLPNVKKSEIIEEQQSTQQKQDVSDAEIKIKSSEISIIQKLWMCRRYFVIEPFVLCWVLASSFVAVSVQNLGLEKACRFNLGCPKYICDNVIDKTLNEIDCEKFESILENDDTPLNITEILLMNGTKITTAMMTNNEQAFDLSENFNYTVCKVERETQKEVTFINGIRGPIAAVFQIIVILFAGGWSDRKGLRKPCMLFPMIGEALSATVLLISSIFFESIPMAFGNILEKVLPAILGGYTLLFMGIYSYLTASTEEKDRTFRFGIFAIIINISQIIGTPFSGTFWRYLGYVYVFMFGDLLLLLGILYIIFYIDEIKASKGSAGIVAENGRDNPAFELTETARNSNTKENSSTEMNINSTKATDNVDKKDIKKKNFLADFFDLTLAYDCVKVFFKKRAKNERFYLILLVASYFLFIGPALCEAELLYQFVLKALNWNGEQYSIYSTYTTVLTPFGTFLMTGIFSKIFKITDSMVGLISSICTVISRPMFAFSKSSLLFYGATTVDMFVSTKAIAIKSVISSFIESEELGRVYSILGIADGLGAFIFPPIYAYIYSSTIDSFTGAFYLFSEIFFAPTIPIFGLTYFLLRKKSIQDAEAGKKNERTTNDKKTLETT